MNINWKEKLTSRKFWAAVAGFVVPLIVAFGVSESDATQIASIIMAGASCIAYILGEGLVDSKRVSETVEDETFEDETSTTTVIGFSSEEEASEV